MGKTMQEAVESLRREFGDDAVILHTSHKRRWFFGRIGPRYYEVLGAYDPNYAKRTPPNSPSTPTRTAASAETEQDKASADRAEWSAAIQGLYGKLVEREIPKGLAQELIKEALTSLPKQEWSNIQRIWAHLGAGSGTAHYNCGSLGFSQRQRIVVLIGYRGGW